MKQTRSKDESKHAAILKAATQLFLKKGYSNTSMDAIATTARVTKQTVYAHYQSKDALFTRMIAELCKKYTPPDTLLHSSDRSVEALLYEIGLSFLNLITSKEGLDATRLVIAEVQRHPRLAQHFYEGGTQRMINLLADFLHRQNTRGVLAIPDPASAASYFFAMLKGRYHLRMIFAIKPTPTAEEKIAHVRETVAIFMKIYGGADSMLTHDTL